MTTRMKYKILYRMIREFAKMDCEYGVEGRIVEVAKILGGEDIAIAAVTSYWQRLKTPSIKPTKQRFEEKNNSLSWAC